MEETGEKMFIRNGAHTVLVSPQGGSVLQWQWQDRMILGPTRIVRVGETLKTRGETHWCLPQFGPTPNQVAFLNWPQHGFLRQTLLTSQARIEPSFQAAFTGSIREGNWQADLILATTLSSQTSGNGVLTCSLGIANIGAFRIPILPALHPYFDSESGISVTVGGLEVPISGSLSQALYLEYRDPIIVCLRSGTVTMKPSDNCETVAVWSDQPDLYLCVEPIFGRPGTFADQQRGRFLDRSESESYSVQFEFTPA